MEASCLELKTLSHPGVLICIKVSVSLSPGETIMKDGLTKTCSHSSSEPANLHGKESKRSHPFIHETHLPKVWYFRDSVPGLGDIVATEILSSGTCVGEAGFYIIGWILVPFSRLGC